MVFHAHSGVRYLVLLAGAAVIAYAVWGIVARRPYGRSMRVLSAVFTGAVDLNVLLGFVLILSGTFYPQLIGHIATMVLAAVVAHVVPLVMRKKPLEERSYLPHLVSAVVVLALVVAGILAIGRPVFPL